MKISAVLTLVFLGSYSFTVAQSRRDDIYSDFVLYNKRQLLYKDLHENVIGKAFSSKLDSNTEHKYEAACRAITQFMLDKEITQQGITQLFIKYDSLQFDTKRAMLEAVYGVYPSEYIQSIQYLLSKETNPVLFTMAAAYSLRYDTSKTNINNIKFRLAEQFPNYANNSTLYELSKYLSNYTRYKPLTTGDIVELFFHQQVVKKKVIYSFQRHSRDYAGLAIIQNANGSFMRYSDGRLMVFEQLARSASGMPYFIADGNTPQGVYSVQGTATTYNKLIGPTPNLQLAMPHERRWTSYFHMPDTVSWGASQDALWAYMQLLPPTWKYNTGVPEAFYAGKVGRHAIIAHGTTIDPEYFKSKPYYPLTPTMGCLCAKELWNVTNGRLLESDQYSMVNAFTSTGSGRGYLYVIDVDNQRKAISRAEVERWVKEFEALKLQSPAERAQSTAKTPLQSHSTR